MLSNWLPVLFCGLLIFYLSSATINTTVVNISNIDLVVHAIFYTVLAFLVARASGLWKSRHKLRLTLVLILLVAIYGAIIEWYQYYLPARDASFADGVANFTGAVLGVVFYAAYHSWREPRLVRQEIINKIRREQGEKGTEKDDS